MLSDLVAKRLPDNNKLLRVVGWSANGGCMFGSRPGVRRYEVSYICGEHRHDLDVDLAPLPAERQLSTG